MTRVEIHKQFCDGLSDLYAAKNADYGDSYAKLRAKYPESICIRLEDKLSRLEQLMKPGYEAQIKDESICDTLRDLANYSLMELTEREYEKQNCNIAQDDNHETDWDEFVPVWSLDQDGVTERYNISGGLNDIELTYDKDADMYELWVETIYDFEDNKSIIRWLDNMEVALWKYVNAAEPDVTYKITLEDAINISNTFTGKTMHECAEKFSFRANCIADFLEGNDSDL